MGELGELGIGKEPKLTTLSSGEGKPTQGKAFAWSVWSGQTALGNGLGFDVTGHFLYSFFFF